MRKRIRAVLDGISTASWSVVRALGVEWNTQSILLLEALCPDFGRKASASPWSLRWKLSLANRIFTTAKSSTKHFM